MTLNLRRRLGIELPLIQAPMAGVQGFELAAAAFNSLHVVEHQNGRLNVLQREGDCLKVVGFPHEKQPVANGCQCRYRRLDLTGM